MWLGYLGIILYSYIIVTSTFLAMFDLYYGISLSYTLVAPDIYPYILTVGYSPRGFGYKVVLFILNIFLQVPNPPSMEVPVIYKLHYLWDHLLIIDSIRP